MIAFLSPINHPFLLSIVALVVAFFASSQDIAIDAYRICLLKPEQRGQGASLTTILYRVAMFVAGALALLIADHWNWSILYGLMALTMVLLCVGSVFLPAAPQQHIQSQSCRDCLLLPFQAFKARFSKKHLVFLLCFVIFYKFSDALALSLNTPFLLREMHFKLDTVAYFSKISTTLAIALSSVLAGVMLPRMGLFRALVIFGWLQVMSVLGFALLSWVGHCTWLMGLVMFLDYFCSGLGNVALIVFLMSLCDKRFTASQYALLSSLSAITRVLIGPVAAYLVNHCGYLDFYLFAFFLGFPVMLLLYKMEPLVCSLSGEVSERIIPPVQSEKLKQA